MSGDTIRCSVHPVTTDNSRTPKVSRYCVLYPFDGFSLDKGEYFPIIVMITRYSNITHSPEVHQLTLIYEGKT